MGSYATDLEHLDEGNAQIEVSEVTEDQAQTEHDADWYNGLPILVVSRRKLNSAAQIHIANSHVSVGVHGHLVARIKGGSKFSQKLRHQRSEGHVPCRQKQG